MKRWFAMIVLVGAMVALTQFNANFFALGKRSWEIFIENPKRYFQPVIQPCTSPKHHFSYVKIHKSGSGAVYNMLARMRINYNLSAALPVCARKPSRNVFPQVPERKFILNRPPFTNESKYDTFIDHGRYDRTAQLEYMHDDTAFFTQIRYPFTQAKSAFLHFHGAKKFNLENDTNPFATFLKVDDGELFYEGNHCLGPSKYKAPVTQNFQAYALGFPYARHNTVSEFLSFLHQLDSELHFVSVLEYKDESAVLLKRKMCWHLGDVMHIHTHKSKEQHTHNSKEQHTHNSKEQNTHNSKEQHTHNSKEQHTHNSKEQQDGGPLPTELDEEAQKMHKERSKLDYILYDFFTSKLLAEIKRQPPDFHEELDVYRRINTQFNELCERMCEDFSNINSSDVAAFRNIVHTGFNVPSSPFNTAFRLSYVDCVLLMSEEDSLNQMVTLQQYPDACDSIRAHGMTLRACDTKNHVFPGYHIEDLQERFLNKEKCLGNTI